MDNVNRPAPMLGRPGMSGPSRTVTSREARDRRVALADLMSNGVSLDEIEEAMRKQFGMNPSEVASLREKVKAQLSTEYEESSPLHKAMASRRLHRHIINANKSRQYGAVAQLEAQLSKVQGTETATEHNITVDARLQQSVLAVLGNMSPAQVTELVASELSRAPAPKQIVETISDES